MIFEIVWVKFKQRYESNINASTDSKIAANIHFKFFKVISSDKIKIYLWKPKMVPKSVWVKFE